MKHLFAAVALGAAMTLAAPVTSVATSLAQDQSTNRPQGGRDDAAIQQKVQDKLKNDKFKDVKADVLDNVVRLTGTVKMLADKSDADRKAHSVDKVKAVDNEIQVAGKQVSDAELTQKIADKLRYDRVGYGNVFNAILLNVQNGVVNLAGEVRTDMDRDSAIAEVEHTEGVKALNDDMKVAPASIMDDEIRIAVARAIYRSGPLSRYANDPGAPIRIAVDRGHVALYGVVDSQVDKQYAEAQANSVSGVFSVDNKLVVANQQSKK
jgi:hyperosmotically inducible protein